MDHLDVTIDISSPTVLSTTPGSGEKGVPRTAALLALLSEPIRPDSVTADAFRLVRGTAQVPAIVSMLSSSALMLVPSSPLEPLTAYTAEIAGLHDLSVHEMEGPYSWSFTTEDRSWTVPFLVSNSAATADAFGATAYVADDGGVVVLWSQSDGTRRRVWSRAYRPSSGWSSRQIVDLNAGTGDASLVPVIAGDGEGAVAVWSQQSGPSSDLWGNRFDWATGWGVAHVIQSGASTAGVAAPVAANRQGFAVTTWTQSGGVYESRYSLAGGWEAPRLLETHSGNAASTSVAMSDTGTAVAAWTENTGGGAVEVWAVSSDDDGFSWKTPSLLKAANSAASVFPNAATCSQGRQVVVWAQNAGTPYSIWSTRQASPVDSWTTAELLEGDDTGNALSPRVSLDPAGNGFAEWIQSDGSKNHAWANRLTAFGWGAPEMLDTSGKNVSGATVAVDASGRALSSWFQGDPSGFSLAWSRFDGEWSPPSPLALSTGLEGAVHMDEDPGSGMAAIVWSQSIASGPFRLWISLFR